MMSTKVRRGLLVVAFASCVTVSLPVLADEITDSAKAMLDGGRNAEAYALLEPLEAQRAGEPAYDFLLGLAALEVGQNTRAVFALERVLAIEPGNVRARAEIGRAYLALGEQKRAKTEFETVRQQNVPEGVQETIDRLLAGIERAEDSVRPRLKGYLEAGLGHDSNVNSATSSRTVAIPGLGIGTLAPGSRETDAWFGSVGGGLNYRHPLGNGFFATAGVSAWAKVNAGEADFNTRGMDGIVGLQYVRGKNTLSFGINGGLFVLDNDRLRNAWGLTGQWQHDIDATRQFSAYAQYAELSYPDQRVRNVDRYVLGAAYAQAVAKRVVVFGSLYAGEEREHASNADHIGNHLWGVRIGAQYRIDSRWTLTGGAYYESRNYGGREPLLNESREDRQTEINLGLDYQIEKNWRATGRVVHVDNHSDINIYRYRRDIASVLVRRDF